MPSDEERDDECVALSAKDVKIISTHMQRSGMRNGVRVKQWPGHWSVYYAGVEKDPCGVCGGDGSTDKCGQCFPADDPQRDKSCGDTVTVKVAIDGASQVCVSPPTHNTRHPWSGVSRIRVES